MITKEEITSVGKTGKTHGVKGEITVYFDKQNFNEEQISFFIFEIDGIFVPFFIEDYRFKTDTTALYKFQGIDEEPQANELTNKTLYVKNEFVGEEDDDSLRIFIGYAVEDATVGNVGVVADVDESTENRLFIINKGEEEILIPVTDDFMVDIDEENRKIYMNLPVGLVDMDLAEEE
jgi:16S rRNA processing protein RimM